MSSPWPDVGLEPGEVAVELGGGGTLVAVDPDDGAVLEGLEGLEGAEVDPEGCGIGEIGGRLGQGWYVCGTCGRWLGECPPSAPVRATTLPVATNKVTATAATPTPVSPARTLFLRSGR